MMEKWDNLGSKIPAESKRISQGTCMDIRVSKRVEDYAAGMKFALKRLKKKKYMYWRIFIQRAYSTFISQPNVHFYLFFSPLFFFVIRRLRNGPAFRD